MALSGLRQPGVLAALGAALLFGAATPIAKGLLGEVAPGMLAGLFYLGSGLGLTLWRRLRHAPRVRTAAAEAGWLVGAILAGGVIAPLLLMRGLAAMPASGAALLLNAEGVFTALLAWFAFGENVDRRIALGMAAISAGALLLGWPQEARFAGLWPALAILGACLGWGIDNNLTRQLALADASWLASVKGLAAGSSNLALALAAGNRLPALPTTLLALLVGFLAYGVSLALFVVALRHLGTARTAAYFSLAPFCGAALALLGGEPLSARLALAGLLMGFGVWLHVTERHEHAHVHEALEHTHPHVHDAHHQHRHPGEEEPPPGVAHTHPHRHAPLRHSHPHHPDMHHRHEH